MCLDTTLRAHLIERFHNTDALDPPPAASVAQALRELRSLNAIEPPEKLTPLGYDNDHTNTDNDDDIDIRSILSSERHSRVCPLTRL